MNLLLRYLLLQLTIKEQRLSRVDAPHFQQPFTCHYRILPNDMGFRDHVPNYRYLSFIELNIHQWFCQQNTIERGKWIIAAQEMIYLKQVRLLSKLSVTSQLIGWDSKYFYFRHMFMVKNTLVGIALTKFVLMANNEVLPSSIIVDKPEHMHEIITTWIANQQAIKKAS